MGQEQKVIEIENLHKNFKDNEVLKNVSLTCEKGKIYGIVGHNGSGKTVLLKCICGFLNYNKGNIYINGKKWVKRWICWIMQGLSLKNQVF